MQPYSKYRRIKRKNIPRRRVLKKSTAFLTALSLYLGYSVGATAILRRHPTVQRHCTKGISLTFDDGPHPYYTPQLLDLLKRYEIKATFF